VSVIVGGLFELFFVFLLGLDELFAGLLEGFAVATRDGVAVFVVRGDRGRFLEGVRVGGWRCCSGRCGVGCGGGSGDRCSSI
jgi:hypothetical protein